MNWVVVLDISDWLSWQILAGGGMGWDHCGFMLLCVGSEELRRRCCEDFV